MSLLSIFQLPSWGRSSSVSSETLNKQSKPKIESFGCTDFLISTADKAYICGRSMEFPIPMKSVITFHAQGEQRTSTAPGNQPGLSWTSKYGYVAVSVFGANDAVDGMNEAGLSCGFLTLQCSEYQAVPPGANSQALELMDVGSWILGNFATVTDVEAALKNVYVWGAIFPPLNSIPGLHIALHDKNGNNLVVEYLGGAPQFYTTSIGILTNDPPLAWHLVNIGNYNNLSPNPAPSIVINGTTIPGGLPGSGMVGLPGDWSSVSRFIKITKIMQDILQSKTALQGVTQALHMLNNVDKPYGVCMVSLGGASMPDITRWRVFKDLTNGKFYYSSYQDQVLRVIDLQKLNFASGKKYPDMPIGDGTEFVIDMTPKN